MSGDAPKVTIIGSSSRQPTRPARIPFHDVKLSDGAQRSHVIPENIFKETLPDLFNLIKQAELSDGALPFDPDNFLDNGQALPSNNSGSSGAAIFDISQHRGSHPQINAVVGEYLQSIYEGLEDDLASASTPEGRNRALVAAEARVRNIADAMAAISVGGVVDADRLESVSKLMLTVPIFGS